VSECGGEMPRSRPGRAYAAWGLAIVGADAREDASMVRRHAEELNLTIPLVLDPDGRINALYGVIGLPTSFVVGRDGRAVPSAPGLMSGEARPRMRSSGRCRQSRSHE
jgi:hypothetical protein